MPTEKAEPAPYPGDLCPDATTEEQVEELRLMLAESGGHWRTVVRPPVDVGITTDPVTGQKFVESGPGPVTVVTFYITHRTL